MKSYFTDTIIIDTPPMFNVLLLDIPYPIVIEFPSFSLPVFSLKATYPIGSHYIKKLYDLLYYASKNIDKYVDYIEKYKKKYMKRYQSIVQLLWNTYEKSWEHQPYVISLVTDLYQESRKDIKEIIKRR
jgi:hypothetical protein